MVASRHPAGYNEDCVELKSSADDSSDDKNETNHEEKCVACHLWQLGAWLRDPKFEQVLNFRL